MTVAPKMCRRCAFTLIEMCAVISVLAMTVGFGSAILILSFRTNVMAAGTLRSIVLTGQIADRFRDDVHQATQAPEKSGSIQRGARQLILTRADGATIVYRFDDQRLIRTIRNGEQEQQLDLGRFGAEQKCEFDFSQLERGWITLRIIESLTRGSERQVEVTAALGGDRR